MTMLSKQSNAYVHVKQHYN